jgi:hypothetical protein
MRISNFLGLLGLLVSSQAISQSVPGEPISITLERSPNPADAPVVVHLTITNNSDQTVILSRRTIPFSFDNVLPPNQFSVRDEGGAEVDYRGDFEYIIEDSSSMPRLGPHQSMDGLIDLRKTYLFSSAGITNKKSITFILPLGSLPPDLEPDPNDPGYASNPNRVRTVSSNELIVVYNPGTWTPPPSVRPKGLSSWQGTDKASDEALALGMSPALNLLSVPSILEPDPRDPSTLNDPKGTCNADQTTSILTAYQHANDGAQTTVTDINAAILPGGIDTSTPIGKIYASYFGADLYGMSGRISTRILALFSATQRPNPGLKNDHITSCYCVGRDPSVAAFIRPGFEIVLCPKFFSLPAVGGYQSRALVLLHEISHFNYYVGSQYVARTWDYTYGQTSDRAMANAVGARNSSLNADSYEQVVRETMLNHGAPGW